MPIDLAAMERIQNTFKCLTEAGIPFPFKIGVVVEGKWAEVGFVDNPPNLDRSYDERTD